MKSFNIPLFFGVLLLIIASGVSAFLRLDLDTDIVRSLPADSVVVSDALDIFANHPIHDQIAVDIALTENDPDLLVACAREVEERLIASGLFQEVGNGGISELIPELALHVVETLPLLFSAAELKTEIASRLQESFIRERLQQSVQKLSSLEGIGQSRLIASDPLGFMEPVMAKMSMLAPLPGAEIYKGFLLSADRSHLLLTARPKSSGTDTASARQIAELLNSIAAELGERYGTEDIGLILTPVGAYRAALDNEEIIRHDVNLALLLSMAGIGLLLFIAFPRPLVGLFSLVPALFGTAFSLFVFSLFHPSISIMVLGFGGAIISITVDHGIAYLLFLDRPQDTRGKEASHEVRAIGILAVLTTCGAFLTLSLSGFPIFVQLGQFTAMGVLFSFLFVHFIFPHLTPAMSAGSRRSLPLQRFVDGFYNTGRPGAWVAVLLAAFLLFFARPDFQVSLESMNTVSHTTMAADKLFASVWGNINQRVVLMLSPQSAMDLQQQNDGLLTRMTADVAVGNIEPAFVPSMLFPGEQLAKDNLQAWKQFWSPARVENLRHQLQLQGASLGFNEQAFSPFVALLDPAYSVQGGKLPARLFALMGITEKEGELKQFINITPAANYNSRTFFDSYHNDGKIFDSPYFQEQLADILFRSFATMLGVIVVSIAILLLFFYASWQLTLITLTPPLFAYICTLGTMNLMGHSLDIPGLMLSIVILGMGVDYSIFFVRAHQRYRDPAHQSFGLVRMAVFMAGTSTLIGFGVLCLAEHTLLQSIGITSLLGIGYSLMGAFLLLPPLLERYFARAPGESEKKSGIAQRIRSRYNLLEAYPRMFARFKLQSDPMFADLPELLEKRRKDIRTILDIGCGYGVPGCWCLEYCEDAKLIGLDPDGERIRVARLAMGERGVFVEDRASDLPALAEPADLILLLDMLHYLDDESLKKLLQDCRKSMAGNGLLLIRYVIRVKGEPLSWSWRLEDMRVRFAGGVAHYRSRDDMHRLLTGAGFTVEQNRVSSTNRELVWLAGRVEKP